MIVPTATTEIGLAANFRVARDTSSGSKRVGTRSLNCADVDGVGYTSAEVINSPKLT